MRPFLLCLLGGVVFVLHCLTTISSEEVNVDNSHVLVKRDIVSTFFEDFLDKHNKYRSRHGSPPLRYNEELSEYAQSWAEHCADQKRLIHNPASRYGENKYWAWAFNVTGEAPVQFWYSQIVDYDFDNPHFTEEARLFTQLIWKDTKELGVGIALRGNTTFIVANYDPPGNIEGEYEENVRELV